MGNCWLSSCFSDVEATGCAQSSPIFCIFTLLSCLPSSPDLWPQLPQQNEREERWPPPSQTVFSPLGTRRPPSKGAWVAVGINSLAGGGDGDSHNQTLEASHPRQARQSSCPHLPYWLLASPRGSLSPANSHPLTHASNCPLV